jgi:putative transposase
MNKTELRQLALDLRKRNTEFQVLHSQVTQQVADRFYQARERFLGGLANKPKKKKPYRYLSLVYPQSGWKLSDTREVGLGKNKKKKARLNQNRLLHPSDAQGVPREPSVSSVRQTQPFRQNPRFFVEEAETLGQSSGKPKNAVGVDLGITRLATLSDGRYIENPKPLERSLERVRMLQRTLSRKRFLSNN